MNDPIRDPTTRGVFGGFLLGVACWTALGIGYVLYRLLFS
jgi:hypothetical protein